MVTDRMAVIKGIEQALCELDESKQWSNFYVKQQIARRENGEHFDLQDHVRAMVYSLLSSQTPWIRIESAKCAIDDIFCNFDPFRLSGKDPELINNQLKEIKCGSLNRGSQMRALAGNIEKLSKLDKNSGGIDQFYNERLTTDEKRHPFESLIRLLAFDREFKLQQMGIPLVAEYLRNVGYDIPKPDRHIMRILGPDHLQELNRKASADKAWSANDLFEAFRIIYEYSKETGYSQAHIDYLLWSYCANGYGQICTKDHPKCEECKIKVYCASGKLK